jgi:proteasome assembly chaperone (PAC2) family protein
LEPAELNKYLKLSANEWPRLENGILIAAFGGWNDAGESATKAVSFLAQQSGATPFARIEPEEFYVFTETRPHVRLVDGTQRELSWPKAEFAVQRNQSGTAQKSSQSIITLIGVEPDLKWRTFNEVIFEVVKRCGITQVIVLGALVAPVPHTRAVPLTGYTTVPTFHERFERLGAHRSHYEGPTGILGVITDYCRQNNINTASLWGAAPSYLSANPNWKVTAALLTAIDELLELDLDLSVMQNRGLQFEKEVSEAVERDSDVQNFVHSLETRYDNNELDDDDDDDDDDDVGNDWFRNNNNSSNDDNELPSAEILIQELEQQLGLRRHNPDEENKK